MYVAVRYQGDEEVFVAKTFKVVCTLSDPHLTKYWLHNTAPSLMQSTRVHSDATCPREHLKHYVHGSYSHCTPSTDMPLMTQVSKHRQARRKWSHYIFQLQLTFFSSFISSMAVSV